MDDTPHGQRLKTRLLVRISLLFLLVFTLLHVGYQVSRGTVIEQVVIDQATVLPSAILINLLNSEERVVAEGHRLVSPTARLSILNGCEGTESLFLIIAAIVAYTARWPQKAAGILAGILLIYLVNQARIVGLWFALRHDRQLFAVMHGYIAPTLIIMAASLFYLWWMQWTLRSNGR